MLAVEFSWTFTTGFGASTTGAGVVVTAGFSKEIAMVEAAEMVAGAADWTSRVEAEVDSR